MARRQTRARLPLAGLPDWQYQVYYDPESSSMVVNYYYKRKKARHRRIESPLAKRVAGYTLLDRDLRTVKGWFEAANSLSTRFAEDGSSAFNIVADSREEDQIVKALFLAAVMFYGKCFRSAKGRRVKLEERDHIPERFKGAHQELMQLRDNYGAHSGEIPYETCEVNLVIEPLNKKKTRQVHLRTALLQTMSAYSDPSDPDGYLELVNHLIASVQNKINALLDAVKAQELPEYRQ